MRQDFEVIVVGGGPGGSTAARVCAQAGLKTLLVEKERFPRYKSCGGCLSQKTVRLLGFDLGPIVERAVEIVKFTYGLKDPFTIRAQRPMVFMVMRDRFDHFLIEKALEKKAEIIQGQRVVSAEETGEGVVVETASGQKYSSRYLIGADGPTSRIAHAFSLVPQDTYENGFGLECEIPYTSLKGFPEEDLERIHLDFGRIPKGYGWIFPKREGLSIGIGGMLFNEKKVKIRHFFDTFLNGLPYIPKEERRVVVGHPLPAFWNERQKIAHKRVLLVGDAAHLMDPLMGEGIYYALYSGRLAAEAILQARGNGAFPADLYQEAVRVQIFDNLKWALYFSRFVFQFTKLAYQTLKSYPDLGDLYLQVLDGTESYQSFVMGIKKRIRALLGGRLSEKIKMAMTGI
jgi:geranylgeranyl reductase family protein